MFISKMISLGNKQSDFRSFLYLPFVYGFFKFSFLSYSLIWVMLIIEENLFCRIYDELNFLWTFNWKLCFEWKSQTLAFSLQPWYVVQKRLLCSLFVNIGALVSDLRSRWLFAISIQIKQVQGVPKNHAPFHIALVYFYLFCKLKWKNENIYTLTIKRLKYSSVCYKGCEN